MDYFGEFQAYMEVRRLAPGTIGARIIQLRKVSRLMKRPVLGCSAADLRHAFHQLQKERLSPGTLNVYRAAVRAYFRFLARSRYIEAHEDPSRLLEAAKEEERLPRGVSNEVVDQVMASLRTNTTEQRRQNLAFKLLYYTGLRASEVLSMTWDRVDLEGGTIRVMGKGRRERLIPIVSELDKALRLWREVQFDRLGSGRVLTSRVRTGGPMQYPALKRLFDSVLRDAGLSEGRITPHCMRHTYAQRLLDNGLGLDQVQWLLGHRQIATTTIYARARIGADELAAVNRL